MLTGYLATAIDAVQTATEAGRAGKNLPSDMRDS
jgi:hypothetical protein